MYVNTLRTYRTAEVVNVVVCQCLAWKDASNSCKAAVVLVSLVLLRGTSSRSLKKANRVAKKRTGAFALKVHTDSAIFPFSARRCVARPPRGEKACTWNVLRSTVSTVEVSSKKKNQSASPLRSVRSQLLRIILVSGWTTLRLHGIFDRMSTRLQGDCGVLQEGAERALSSIEWDCL